jgi:hypothetical protein
LPLFWNFSNNLIEKYLPEKRRILSALKMDISEIKNKRGIFY